MHGTLDCCAALAAPLGVVPIFVNAGAAVLPAVVAPLVSAAALLMNPRQLGRLCVRRPWVPVVALAAIAGLWWGIARWSATPTSASADVGPAAAAAAAATTTDWVALAEEIIRLERAGLPTILSPSTRPAGGAATAAAGPASTLRLPVGYRNDFSRAGHDGSPPPRGLVLAWARSPMPGAYLSSPVVHGNRLYATAANTEGGGIGGVFCLDATSGELIWARRDVDGVPLAAIFATPTLSSDGRSLIVGQGLHEHTDCALLCLDAETGSVRWSVETPLHVESSPAVFGDVVVAGAGAVENLAGRARGHKGQVVAVRVSDGRVLWRHAVIDPESSPAFSADGSVVFIGSGFNGKAVVALRTEEESKLGGGPRELWRTAVPYPATGPVTLAGDLVILGTSNVNLVNDPPSPAGALVALDAKTGSVRWQKPMVVIGPVAHADGKLAAPRHDGKVTMLRAADGEELWTAQVSARAGVLAGPALTATHVYAVSRDGVLVVLDAATGAPAADEPPASVNDAGRPAPHNVSISSPTIAGGRLYVGSETGGVRCYVGGKGVAR